MSIKIYVDELNPGGRSGLAKNEVVLKRNAEILRGMWARDPTQSPYVFPAGKYVCLVVTDASGEPGMVFLDFHDHRDVAEKRAMDLHPELQEVFLQVVDLIEKNYELVKNDVELVLVADPGTEPTRK